MPTLHELIEKAARTRLPLVDEQHLSAFRLFNGFYEGEPRLAVDIYARTALIHNYADTPLDGASAVRTADQFLTEKLPWVQTVIVKVRSGTPEEKRGVLLRGTSPDQHIRENGVRYAVALTMNRDASYYMDTRNLRRWAKENLRGKTVLNTFAYTGSLGVAACAGGAARVVHLDKNRKFLNIAKTSYTLNGFPIDKRDFIANDFFPALSHLKRDRQTFDCIFLDPPFFSITGKGRVDMENDPARLINKTRPLVNDGGWLVVINNALYINGAEHLETLESLCADGHLAIETLIPVPEDFTGYPTTRVDDPPVNPAPFNHPTKIVILRVKHKRARTHTPEEP